MKDLETELERRTVTYTVWNQSTTNMDNGGWHPFTFSYADAGSEQIKKIKVCLIYLSVCPRYKLFFSIYGLCIFRISTTYTMKRNTGQSGAVTILHLFPVFYSQENFLKELQCAFWVKEWLATLMCLHYCRHHPKYGQGCVITNFYIIHI